MTKAEAALPEAVRAAKQREKERLERLASRKVTEDDHINQMAALIPDTPLPEFSAVDFWFY